MNIRSDFETFRGKDLTLFVHPYYFKKTGILQKVPLSQKVQWETEMLLRCLFV